MPTHIIIANAEKGSTDSETAAPMQRRTRHHQSIRAAECDNMSQPTGQSAGQFPRIKREAQRTRVRNHIGSERHHRHTERTTQIAHLRPAPMARASYNAVVSGPTSLHSRDTRHFGRRALPDPEPSTHRWPRTSDIRRAPPALRPSAPHSHEQRQTKSPGASTAVPEANHLCTRRPAADRDTVLASHQASLLAHQSQLSSRRCPHCPRHRIVAAPAGIRHHLRQPPPVHTADPTNLVGSEPSMP